MCSSSSFHGHFWGEPGQLMSLELLWKQTLRISSTGFHRQLFLLSVSKHWRNHRAVTLSSGLASYSLFTNGLLTRSISEFVKHLLLFQCYCFFRSTHILIKWVSDVRTCVRPSPSTNTFFDFNEIWPVGRGRWVMHGGMQYDPIHGQGHKPLSWKSGHSQKLFPPPFTMGTGNWPPILKLGHNI